MSGKALIVIDMLNDFVKGKQKCARASRIVAPLKDLVQAAREREIPVIYCNDAHIKGIDRELEIWGEHAIAGTKGAEVIEELKPAESDYLIPKRRYSGFFQTGLRLLLDELGIDTLIITGLLVNICVRHTVADAYYWGYNILVPGDATEDSTEEGYKSGLDYMARIYGAELTTAAEAIESF